MSAGAPFILATNRGAIDEMMVATGILKKSLEMEMARRTARGDENTIPDIYNIEETHRLLFYAGFKPYVLCALEFAVISAPSTATTSSDIDVSFAVPQYGEFFGPGVVHMRYASGAYYAAGTGPIAKKSVSDYSTGTTTVTVDSFSEASTANVITAVIAAEGASLAATQLTVGGRVLDLSSTTRAYSLNTEIVSFDGRVLGTSASVRDTIKYVDFPGEFGIKKASFKVNGNPIAEFTFYDYMYCREFELPAHKKEAYYRAMGQELPIEAKSASNPVTGSTDNVAMSSGSMYRTVKQIVRGHQTPQYATTQLDCWSELLFWFSRYNEGMILSAAIPSGQRMIDITFRAPTSMVSRGPAGWHHTWVNVYDKTDLVEATDVKHECTIIDRIDEWTVFNTNGAITGAPTLTAELYIGHLFVLPLIHDIFVERVGFFLVRLLQNQTYDTSAATTEMRLTTRFPTENIRFGLWPTANLLDAEKWHKASSVTERSFQERVAVSVSALATTAVTSLTNVFGAGRGENFTYFEEAATIDTAHLKSHGAYLTPVDAPMAYFSNYQSTRFGAKACSGAVDKGQISFALENGEWEFSSHFDMSRARETDLTLKSSVISSTTTGRVVIQTTAINFLMIAEGSAVLRFAS
jgi:hypothetical protein|uniref:Uncharacterized protein n=1 Tax=viral metagenome TaxID=1070528 RepID=A0A6C0IW25_9ZZZZ